ncbi:MAG: excalibur calcium-binding domain-containing protein [Gammaproteobacteria bacterium]|nr:excalibur calcium-binding domain-containing protein [Gammaproteobacteria bacterium]
MMGACVIAAGFKAYELYGPKIIEREIVAPIKRESAAPTISWSTGERKKSQFICDGRQYCSQMRSRAEAEYFNFHCPDTKMDGDRDGIPCENDSRW